MKLAGTMSEILARVQGIQREGVATVADAEAKASAVQPLIDPRRINVFSGDGGPAPLGPWMVGENTVANVEAKTSDVAPDPEERRVQLMRGIPMRVQPVSPNQPAINEQP